jgi:hypothetical protein
VLQGGEEEPEYVEGRHGELRAKALSALVSEEGRRGYHCIYMARGRADHAEKVDCM